MDSLAIEVGQTLAPEATLFWILAPLAVVAALGMLFVKKAVHSALLLAWVMVTLAIFLYRSRCTLPWNCSDNCLHRCCNDVVLIYSDASWR
jgi:hypothetical protein